MRNQTDQDQIYLASGSTKGTLAFNTLSELLRDGQPQNLAEKAHESAV